MKKKKCKILTIDTETYDGLLGDLKRIAIFDGKKVTFGFNFKDILHVIEYYYDKNFMPVCYIHNLEFDLRKIPEVLKYADWKKCFIINNHIVKFSTKKFILQDSFRLLPYSLSKLSKDFNVEHGKLNLFEEVSKKYPNKYYDVVDFLNKCDVNDELFLKYLEYDVVSLYEILEKIRSLTYLDENEFSQKMTTSSLSRSLFKKGLKKPFRHEKYLKNDYDIMTSFKWTKEYEDAEELVRASYFGGRTEVFTPVLENKAFHYDMNSQYPFVMIDSRGYPIGKPIHLKDELAKTNWENWIKNHHGCGFLSCDVYVPEQYIPPLPCKMGKLTFPCGFIFGTWTYEELEYSIKECCVQILKIHECVYFERMFPIFEMFIKEFYQLKENASLNNNEALRTFSKLIMNTAYGYLGMRRDNKTSLLPYEQINDLNDESIISINPEMGYVEVRADVSADYIQPQIASYVTSRARIILLKTLKYCVDKGKIYYCDTDSIVCDCELPNELIDKNKLGFWDLEKKPIKGLFIKPKVYVEVTENLQNGELIEKTNVKFKGISKTTQEKFNYDTYLEIYHKILSGKENEITLEENKTLLRSIIFMLKNNLEHNFYELRNKKMYLNSPDKRIINFKENYSKPYFFKSIKDFENFSYKDWKKTVNFDMDGV